MGLDRRFCFTATAFFVTTIVLKGSSGLIVPPRPSTSDDFPKKLNQISAFDQLPETGSSLDRKAHGRYQRDVQSNQARLEIYEVNVETQTVSVRLTPLALILDGVDSYIVKIVYDEHGLQYYQKIFAVSQELHCELWDDALCFKNLSVASISGWDFSESKIKVSGEKNGLEVAGKQWECKLQSDLPRKDPSSPIDLSITNPSPGTVRFQWKHPLFPDSTIPMFRVRFSVIKTNTSLIESQIHPSRRLHVEVVADNRQGFGTPAADYFTISSRIDFETPAFLSVGPNGTWAEFQVPGVFNVTVNTWVKVTVEGPMNCTKNGSSADQTVDDGTSRYFNINGNGIRDSESTCYLQPGRSYVIKAEDKDKVTTVSAVPIESIEIVLLGDDGEVRDTK